MLHGLDVSSMQGTVPWDRLTTDYRFVICKAQQGNDGFDPMFWKNADGAKAQGLIVGAYHFAYPLPHIDPRKQAQEFFDKSRGFGTNIGELPPFLDLEWPAVNEWAKWKCTPEQIRDWTEACLDEMTKLWGVKPYLYIYLSWWEYLAAKTDVSFAADYELWMAWYVKGWPQPGQKPRIPKPFTRAPFWQFDGNGGLVLPNGVDADFCVFDGTQDELNAIANGPCANYGYDTWPTVTRLP